ncbi:hypothetical protein [Halopseudomonas sp.]|uniref:hypothetical protein n=2 Tax=Pseudomonadaceae TaxID=135621 RepID=UPI0030035D5A|nr:hypothetical protein [Halopseudomonas aestusnigri]
MSEGGVFCWTCSNFCNSLFSANKNKIGASLPEVRKEKDMTRRYSAWFVPALLALGFVSATLVVAGQSDLPAPSFASIPVVFVSDMFSRF